jgi:competence protein ComEC
MMLADVLPFHLRAAIRVCVALCSLYALLGAGRAEAAAVTGDLKIFVLNIGQGDAILIVCPHGTHQMLIDAAAQGYPGSQTAFQTQLRSLMGTDHTLEVVVSSHPHQDHVGGLEWVLSTFKVKKFIDSGFPYTSKFSGVTSTADAQEMAGTLLHLKAKDFPASHLADFCPATNVKAELLIPTGYGPAAKVNNESVVVLVSYNAQKFLFTGDAEKKEEKLLLDDPVTAARLQNVTLYKVGHHGAETSSTAPFLAAIKPSMAAMSSGCKNVAKNKGYRHPRAVIIDALDAVVPGAGLDVRSLQAGKPAKGQWTKANIHRGVYATSADGTFVIVANGSSIDERAQVVTGAPSACSGS